MDQTCCCLVPPYEVPPASLAHDSLGTIANGNLMAPYVTKLLSVRYSPVGLVFHSLNDACFSSRHVQRLNHLVNT